MKMSGAFLEFENIFLPFFFLPQIFLFSCAILVILLFFIIFLYVWWFLCAFLSSSSILLVVGDGFPVRIEFRVKHSSFWFQLSHKSSTPLESRSKHSSTYVCKKFLTLKLDVFYIPPIPFLLAGVKVAFFKRRSYC